MSQRSMDHRALADRLFEIVRQEDARLTLDALGLAMTRVLLELEVRPVAGRSHREIFEEFMQHMRLAGERVMKVFDLEA